MHRHSPCWVHAWLHNFSFPALVPHTLSLQSLFTTPKMSQGTVLTTNCTLALQLTELPRLRGETSMHTTSLNTYNLNTNTYTSTGN